MDDLNPRDALFGYRLRFAPETQPIRQTVLDNIVLQNIRKFDGRQGATVGKLRNLSIRADQKVAIALDDAKASLLRLEKAGRVESKTIRAKQHWSLTELGAGDINEKETHTARMRGNVAKVLFGEGASQSDLASSFFSALGLIFDEITIAYLEAMFSDKPSPLTPSIVETAVSKVADGHSVDKSKLISAVRRFFREETPEFDWIKWTYCKNYYSVRAMGLGAGGDVLSATLFSGASFFLDTNVIICALDPSSERHLSAKQVLAGLSRIGCDLKVLQITLDELRDLAEKLKENLGNVLRQIPNGLLDKTEGLVARAEARHRQDETAPTPEELLDGFGKAEALVVNRLNASVVHDDWFDKQQENQDIITLSGSLQQLYGNSTVGRRKTEAAALHDALALTYMADLCRGDEDHAYFLTLDRSLPHYKPASLFDGLRVNRAITVEALLPWLGAISQDDEGAAEALSGVLASDLLPATGGYALQEFRMLAELGMDCSQMPSDDVEQCLLYLRREARDINLATAEDREKLHALVKGFFSSPDRKYLAELNTLKTALENAEAEAAAERTARRESQEREKELKATLRQKKLSGSVARRLTLAATTWIMLLVGGVIIAQRYGVGENVLQKVGSIWWLFGVSTAVCLAFARFLCRGELWNTARDIFRTVGE